MSEYDPNTNDETERPDEGEGNVRGNKPESDALNSKRDGTKDELKELLSTPEGRDTLARMLLNKENLPGLPPMTPEQIKVFNPGAVWKNGFLRQIFMGEFDLTSPLSAAEREELRTTTDHQRKMLLEIRTKNSSKKGGRRKW